MKKLLSIILVLVLCTSLMALTASAAGGHAISITTHELAEGTKTVVVTASITANDGMGALTVNPVYDAAVLELTECVWTTGLNWMAKANTGASFVDSDGSNYTGTLVTMTFNVLKEEATNVGLKVQSSTTDEKLIDYAVGGGSVKFICNHDWVETENVPSTCKELGHVSYKCSKCGETKTDKLTTLAEHTFGAWTVTKAADCVNKGEEAHTCSVCGKTETREVAAAGHKWTQWTKGDDGKLHRECTVCGAKETQNDGGVVPGGDITPVLTMGAVAMISMLAAVAFVFKRKFAK